MKKQHIIYLLICCLNLSACKKSFLELKQNKSLVTPSTLKDYQGLMDNDLMYSTSSHTLGIIGGDESVLSDALYGTLNQTYKPMYRWDKDPYPNVNVTDWNYAYRCILYANTALSGAKKLKHSDDREALNNLKGTALFYRGLNFYQLTQTFCKPYTTATAGKDPGIPLRLEEDINLTIGRGSLQNTYSQIISDLELAGQLLPVNPLIKTRPSKPAVYAMLAKSYLQMGNYNKAIEYATEYLTLKPDLLDFNTVNLQPNYPFTDYKNNIEVILLLNTLNNPVTGPTRVNINPQLLNSFASNDLRKQAYFRYNIDGRVLFRGAYSDVGGIYFTGIATDEIYLIRAECYARINETNKALIDLNTLRKNRYDKASYEDATAPNSTEALKLIISERRKELLIRGTRWEDLRRLNLEPEFAVTLFRTINGKTYTLPPNDNRYTWPLPDQEVTINKLAQNPK